MEIAWLFELIVWNDVAFIGFICNWFTPLLGANSISCNEDGPEMWFSSTLLCFIVSGWFDWDGVSTLAWSFFPTN